MTVAVSNVNCERAVNRCGGGRTIIRFSTNLHFIPPGASLRWHYKCQHHFAQLDFDIVDYTCNKRRFNPNISPDELEHFLIAFYLVHPISNGIFKHDI